MLLNQPNQKFSHLYVVVRYDKFQEGSSPETCVTLTKAFNKEEDADQEARRLNDLNGHKESLYFVRVARVVAE